MKSDMLASARLFHNKTLILLLLFPLCLLVSFFTARFVGGVSEMRTARLLLVPVLAVFLPVMFFLRMEVCGENALGARRFPLSALWRAGLFLLTAVCFFASYACLLLWLGESPAYTLYWTGIPGTGFTVASFFAFAVLPALGEEILCRGLLLSHFRAYGILLSVTVCAIASAVLFFPAANMLPFWFIFGLLSGVLRLQSGSVFPSLLASLLFRTALYFGASPWKTFLESLALPLWIPGAALFVMGLVFAVLMPDGKALSFLAGQIRKRQGDARRRALLFLLFPLTVLLAVGLYLSVYFGVL